MFPLGASVAGTRREQEKTVHELLTRADELLKGSLCGLKKPERDLIERVARVVIREVKERPIRTV
jgi:hypothetical protein